MAWIKASRVGYRDYNHKLKNEVVKMLKLCLFVSSLLFAAFANAQFSAPVSWSFSQRDVAAGKKHESVLQLKAVLRPGWHVFSQHLKPGGPTPTLFSFQHNANVQLLDAVIEPKSISYFEPLFKMNVSYFENEVQFEQRIRMLKPTKSPQAIKGKVEFMVCSAKECLPPDEVEFEIALTEKIR